MTWTLQGMWVSMCLLCVLTALSSYSGVVMNSIFFIGLTVFISGLAIEIIADNQKTVFRSNFENKDNFLKKYSIFLIYVLLQIMKQKII